MIDRVNRPVRGVALALRLPREIAMDT